jgi:NADPH-dependent 2,4-dienoyl-CoA reductase/sulfur reductase-like enzyme
VRFRSEAGTGRIETPLVALHEGVIPASQAARSIGCAFRWNASQHCFEPQTDEWGETSVPGVFIAGDGGGIGGARVAEHEGHIVAAQALHRTGRVDVGLRDRLSDRYRAGFRWHMSVRPFLDRMFPPPDAILRPADDVIICRCEEVTAGAVRAVVKQGCQGPNQAKSFLRAGMGACQGRLCGHTVVEVIADARGVSVDAVGYYRVRPPITPISVGELASVEGAEA